MAMLVITRWYMMWKSHGKPPRRIVDKWLVFIGFPHGTVSLPKGRCNKNELLHQIWSNMSMKSFVPYKVREDVHVKAW